MLPARFGHAAGAWEGIEAAWRRDGASGAAGFLDGRLVGYLFGAPDDEAHWGGPNVWVGHAGHAAVEPELVRDLYGLAADRWADEGRPRHYVQVPASEGELLQAWYRVGVGHRPGPLLGAAAAGQRRAPLPPPRGHLARGCPRP